MSLRLLRFITLMLAALGMTMGAAHLLELPPKTQYDGHMYAAVNSTLYRLYGSVGGGIQVSAILAAIALSFVVRARPTFRLTLSGTLCLLLSLGLWLALVQPVNAAWFQVLHTTPQSAPEAYLQLRSRWEYGHVAAFIAWFSGVSLLMRAVLAETPAHR
jgi:hypothetical protein